MKKDKWLKGLGIVRQFGIYFFVWFGVSTLMDYFFFEEVIDNQVIADNLGVAPFMALLFMFIKGVQKGEESESTAGQPSVEKE
jgi:hypothetical protein